MSSTNGCEPATSHQYLFIILDSVLAIVSIVGNSLALVAIWRTPRLHSPSNVLLAGLALSDLGAGLVSQPIGIIFTLVSPAEKMKINCIFDHPILAIYVLSANLFVSISLVTLTAISVDRYLALRLHLRYRELVTVKRVLMALVTMWIAAVLVFVVPMAIFRSVLSLTTKLVVISMCFLTTLWCYSKIFNIVRRHQSQIQAQVVIPQNEEPSLPNIARYKKSVSNVLYIVGIFLISYIPWLSAISASSLGVRIGGVIWKAVFTHMFCNSCVNPVLYCWRMREIRQAVKNTVLKCCS